MRKFLWAVFFLSIIAMLPLICLRVSNEKNNKTVILAGRLSDYAFNCEEKSSAAFITQEKLKASGLSAIIADENEVSSRNATSCVYNPLLEKLYKSGLEIIIQLQTLDHSDEFYNQLSRTIGRFNVKYILICPDLQNSWSKVTNTSVIENIINKNNLTVFIMENKEQNGFIDAAGLSHLITKTNYRINRAFSIRNSILEKTSYENAVYVWLRSVIDRNIRMVVIGSSAFMEDNNSYSSSNKVKQGKGYTEELLCSAGRLQVLLFQRGFNFNPVLKPLNTMLPGTISKIPVFINLFAAAALYLLYFFSLINYSAHRMTTSNLDTYPKSVLLKGTIALFTAILFIIALFVYWHANNRGDIGTAFISVLVYPSLSSLLIMKYLSNPKAKNEHFYKRLSITLLIMLFTCLSGAAVIVSSMCDIRYTMHLINYNLVTPAFTIPLLIFTLNFIVCRKAPVRSINFKKPFKPDIPAAAGACIFFLATALFLYIERNGNSSLIQASSIELEIRKLLELAFYTRPRTKEFLVSYPSLFIFVFLYNKNTPNCFLYTAGLLSTITCISILNSFCHGFTPAATSLVRSAEGLLLGTITGLLSIIILNIISKLKSSD